MTTHHGPWCDDHREEVCETCSAPPASVDIGVWLLARLWMHDTYNRGLARFKQETIWGGDLNSIDWLEISQLRLTIARINTGIEEVR